MQSKGVQACSVLLVVTLAINVTFKFIIAEAAHERTALGEQNCIVAVPQSFPRSFSRGLYIHPDSLRFSATVDPLHSSILSTKLHSSILSGPGDFAGEQIGKFEMVPTNRT